MVYNEELASRLRVALASQAEVEEKKMFGGVTFMVGGQMCCGVLKDDLVVKIDPEYFDAAIAQPHVRPFDFSGRPMTGMVYVASAGLPSEQVLQQWVQRGLDNVKTHPKAKARRSTKRSSPR